MRRVAKLDSRLRVIAKKVATRITLPEGVWLAIRVNSF